MLRAIPFCAATCIWFMLLNGCAHPRPIATIAPPSPTAPSSSPTESSSSPNMQPPAPVDPERTADWIDLQATWRLRVTIPIMADGGYTLKKTPFQPGRVTATGLDQATINLTGTVSDDFLGYEVALYSLEGEAGGPVQVKFNSVQQFLVGEPPTRSEVPHWALPKTRPFVRLLHMLRVSEADHDDALLSGMTREDVELLTKQVQADTAACRASQRSSCSWIPTGVAILPQNNVGIATAEEWVGLH